ncbi:hypothetical protein OsI_10121 [Oryza sativa Indica Group]|jgi:hypothetical protein|uniref:Epidermal patterning factor-like protein n=5 Tax=Oryza TaxID=4527 RepID=Q8H7Y4_ORYSJ|nr:Hypothetical protein [Oryza sativa Japonica Group]EAY88647.1 hypothetical protein OsI_10121 [Oryza sativa Indica Group]EAZ25675.1 hypothetical protein OsJ_09505 [Oryza sativa Japonica Group]
MASARRGRRRRVPVAASPLLILLVFLLAASLGMGRELGVGFFAFHACSDALDRVPAVVFAGACSSARKRSGDGGGAVAEEVYYSSWGSAVAVAGRRRLVGPGSSPPTCRSRCGGCHPCRPVHVAIQPGRSFPLEYYPEAWRCKCGDKLFMP